MPETVFPVQGATLSLAAFSKQPALWKMSVLGVLCFSADAAASPVQDLDVPCLRVAMPRLDGADAVSEVWHGSNALTQGRSGALHYGHDDEVLFGVIEVSEAAFAADAGKTPLQQAAESAYRQVFAVLDTLGFPQVFRFWNYFADINAHSFGLERYRQFNRGRQDAFMAGGRHEAGIYPAACALGVAQGPLRVAFLAGRVAPLNLENPRQISAYHYPQQYGPRTPMFSRASVVRLKHAALLFISGTASIVGHETLHAGDVLAQTGETMANIKAVLAEAHRAAGLAFSLADLNYRVYVRNPGQLEPIRNALRHCVGAALKAVYLRADVCRQDLLLEIEATATQSSASAGEAD